MARSITFKFGADTSQLTRALGSVRKSIGGMLGGISLGGILGAGIAGFGIQQLIGSAMNISPTFANTMLDAEERAVRGFANAMYDLPPQILQLADTIPVLVSGSIKLAARFAEIYGDVQSATSKAAGLYTEAVLGVMGRFSTASSYRELFGPSLMQGMAGFGALTNAIPFAPDVNPQALEFIEGVARRQATRSIGGVGGQARTQVDPARTAEPRP